MDKKTGIILGVIIALIVILVGVVMVLDTKTVTMDKDTLIVVEGEEYTIQEFEKFAKIVNHKNGDINKKMTEEETLTMLDEFLLQKLYLDAAKSHNITLESVDISTIDSDYEKDQEIFAKAYISKEDYEKQNKEKALVEKLKRDFSNYYELPEEIYTQFKESWKEEDLYKTYSFRLMTIPYENPKSGDESGDVVDILESGLASGDEEKEDLSREAQLKVAEDVLLKIKSGDNFEELAKEYGSSRLTFSGTEYKLINGDLEYAVSPLLESKINNIELYNRILEMNSGDVTEVVEDEEYTTFQILKLESVEEGFVGEAEKELKGLLLNDYANDVVSEGKHYEMNQSAYIRSLYK